MAKVLMLANVASMILQFNMRNIIILKKMGYDVEIACNFENGNTCSLEKIVCFKKELDGIGVKYHQIDFMRGFSGLLNQSNAINELNTIFRDNKYEFVHCHSLIGGILCRKIAKKFNVPVIYTAHGFVFYKGSSFLNWAIFYPIEKKLSKITDILITINQEDYSLSKKKFKSVDTKMVCGIGIDLGKFNNLENSNSNIRKRIGINDDDYLILSIGELTKRKNHIAVIKAIRQLPDARIKYGICGIGSEIRKLKEYVKKYKLDKRVLFFGYCQNVREYLAMCDLFVFPSFSEGLPVALMEAMAMKKNILCSNIRGNSDLIKDKNRLFNPKNIHELKIKIDSLFTCRNNLPLMVDYPVLQNYSSELVDKEMESIYFSMKNRCNGDC